MGEYLTVETVGAVLTYLFVCGLGGGYCSAQKDRLGIEGFMLGLLFGPFGVVAAACLPTAVRAAAPARQAGHASPAAVPPPVPRPGRRLLGEVEG